MQNFSYKRPIDPQDVIVEKPKKKINMQQKAFTLVFGLIFIILGWYFSKDLFVATFDGNIISYHGESHLISDAFILDVKVKPGDIVEAGDTMLLFLYTDMLYSAMNSTTISDYQQKLFALKMAKDENLLELRSLQNQEKAIIKIKEGVRKNIPLGLHTAIDERDYVIELERIRRNISYVRSKINLYSYSARSANYIPGPHMTTVLDPFEITREYANNHLDEYGEMLQYMVAPEKTLILAINKYPSNVVFKGDPIMLIYPIEEGRKRIHIEMIVPPEFLNEMQDGQKVDIDFGKQSMGKGTIKINNTYMRSVRPIKLGQFSTDNEGAIIRVNIDSIDNLSLKYQINGLPIKLNYKREWNIFNKTD